MTTALERKIEILEAELQEKDQLITQLHRQAVVASILPTYLHETTNILNGISLELMNLFERGRATGVEIEVERITQKFENLREINHHLWHFGWSSRNTVSLNECLRKTTELLYPLFVRSRTVLQTRLSEEGEIFAVSDWAIRQVIVNILLNALGALQDTTREDRRVIIETTFDDVYARIQISDNGCGIKAKFVDKIWEPGFTTKPDKFGMGLTVANNIVRSLDGNISVFSHEGDLTQFTVMLPLKLETAG